MAIPEFLRRLLETPGPSGSEAPAAAVWREAAAAFADVSADPMGNSLARVAGTGDGPPLAIFGHVDEIGLTVTNVDESGFLSVRGIGGWNPEVLVAQRVEVLAREGRIPGVIAAERDPKRAEDKRRVEVKELHVDIGARNRDEARSLVRPGDPAVLVAPPLELRNGRIVSRSLDNRLGAYVALEAARRVAEAGGAAGEVVAVATVGEEVGDYLGARTSAFALDPGLAIVVDVTWTTDMPGGDASDFGEIRLGGGASILRGPGIAPSLFDLLVETAEAEGIAYQIEVSTGRSSTDADAVSVSRAGVATGVVLVPLRYMHTPTEVCQLEDVETSVALVAAVARRLGPETVLSR